MKQSRVKPCAKSIDSLQKPRKRNKKQQTQQKQRIPTIFENLNLPILKYGQSFAKSLQPQAVKPTLEDHKTQQCKIVKRKGNVIYQECLIKDLIKYAKPYIYAPIKATKDNPTLQWILYVRVNVVWDWRGEVRFFVVDQTGNQAKCILQKQAYKKFYRDSIKKNQYYRLSKGIASFNKDNQVRVINFSGKSQIQQIPPKDFKLSKEYTLPIHMVATKIIDSLPIVSVIGILKDGVDKSQFMKKGRKNMYSIVLVDPIHKFQIKVNQFYIDQYIEGGQVCVLHLYQVVDTIEGTYALKSTRVSYYTIESDLSDKLVEQYKKAAQIAGWRQFEYECLKKQKFINRTLFDVLKLVAQCQQDKPLLSIINVLIIDIKVNELQQSDDQRKAYSLKITCEDQTQKLQVNLGWQHVGKLTDLTLDEYEDTCQKQSREQLQANLQMFLKTKVTIELKSRKNHNQQYHHKVQNLQVWKQQL